MKSQKIIILLLLTLPAISISAACNDAAASDKTISSESQKVSSSAWLNVNYAGVIPVSIDPTTGKVVMLLGLRKPTNNHQSWGDFGGKVEGQEFMDEGARREGQEELMIKAQNWVNPDALYTINDTFDPAFNASTILKLENNNKKAQIHLVALPHVTTDKWLNVLKKIKNDDTIPTESRQVCDFAWINIDDVIAWIRTTDQNKDWTASLAKGHRLFRNTAAVLRENLKMVECVNKHLTQKIQTIDDEQKN